MGGFDSSLLATRTTTITTTGTDEVDDVCDYVKRENRYLYHVDHGIS